MKKIEYVFSISSDCVVCKNRAKLKSFLSLSELSLVKDELSLDKECCKIKITERKIKNSDGVVYTFVFMVDSDEEPVKLLKTFRQVIGSVKDNKQKNVTILELQNDFAKDRSEKIYSVIYTLENSMRRLISRFMLETLGMEWVEATPQDVKKSVKDNKCEWNNACLYRLDFIQLSYFLTTPYADNKGNVLDELKNCIANGFSENDKEQLKLFVPKNNWDRYFKELVPCDSDKFESMWKKIYDYRCDVAHNRIVSLETYQECVQFCKEMQRIVDGAIEQIDGIEIKEPEREKVVECTLKNVFESIHQSVLPTDLLLSMEKMRSSINPLIQPYSKIVEMMQGINGAFRVSPEMERLCRKMQDFQIGLEKSPIYDCLKNLTEFQTNKKILSLDNK